MKSEVITNPDVAIRSVLLGESAGEVIARCRIEGVFERREWLQANSTFSTVLSCCPQSPRFDQCIDLVVAIIAMCDRHRAEYEAKAEHLTAVG